MVKDIISLDTISENPTIIKFYADWCGPCQRYAIPYHKVEQNRHDVEFFQANVDIAFDLTNHFRVGSFPTTIFLVRKREVNRQVGFMSYQDLIKFINNSIKNA